MNPLLHAAARPDVAFSRRAFLQQSGLGLGTLAMAYLFQAEGSLASEGTPGWGAGGMDLQPTGRPFPGAGPGRHPAHAGRRPQSG
jgi:hypothetical protein